MLTFSVKKKKTHLLMEFTREDYEEDIDAQHVYDLAHELQSLNHGIKVIAVYGPLTMILHGNDDSIDTHQDFTHPLFSDE